MNLKKYIFAGKYCILDSMNIIQTLKRPFIWLIRFRHRCGYGVHSPFAFELITCLIYEKSIYYAYKQLPEEEKKQALGYHREWRSERRKVKHLLFRLVNRFQPHTIVDAGIPSSTSLYMQAGNKKAGYVSAADLSELFLDKGIPVDFLYLHFGENVVWTEDAFRVCVERTTPKSVFVIKGIRYSKAMEQLWDRLKKDDKVGITFDLYDVGLLFFDKSKIKQHYIVNF